MGSEPQELTPGQRAFRAINSAYDLSTPGIGPHRYLLDSLVQNRGLNEWQDTLFCNEMVNPLLIKKKLVGERYNPLLDKYRDLEKQGKGICNIVLRSVARIELTLEDSDPNEDDYRGFVNGVLPYVQKYSDCDALLAVARAPLREAKLTKDLTINLMRSSAVFPSKEFIDILWAYKRDPRLRNRHITYFADKLELMVDTVEAYIEVARGEGIQVAQGYNPVDDQGWKDDWKESFGEELPPIFELIRKARESIRAAREHLSNR